VQPFQLSSYISLGRHPNIFLNYFCLGTPDSPCYNIAVLKKTKKENVEINIQQWCESFLAECRQSVLSDKLNPCWKTQNCSLLLKSSWLILIWHCFPPSANNH